MVRGCPQYDFMISDAETTAFFGANRSGKTTANVIKAIIHSTGRYPPWWKARKFYGPTEGRMFVQDYKKGGAVIIKKLKEWMPRDAYYCQPKRGNLGVEIDWYLKHVSGGVSHFDIMTYESDTFSAEGWDGHWVGFDEPPPRDMYIAAIRGLVDQEGLCWFSLTPLKEPWLFDQIYSSKNKNVFSVVCDMRHNLQRINPLSGLKIGLTERSIQRFEQELTEEERETRAHGRFRYLAGRVWKEWDRDIHTFDRFKEWPLDRKSGVIIAGQPPIHWPRVMLLDPHDRTPHALLWVACDECGDYWAYREKWYKDERGDAPILKEVAQYCKKVETESKERITVRVLDPNFGPKRYGNTGISCREELEMSSREIFYPMRFIYGDDHKELGRKAFAELLKFDRTRPISLVNHPKFRAASDLKEYIYQVEHYVWDEYKSIQNRDAKEKPKDINTHFPDLSHYLALSKFETYKPVIYEGTGNFYAGNC